MTDDTSDQHPLTDQALTRLRKLAEGNGLSPDAIQLVGTEEKIYELEGILSLAPKTEIQQGRYAGTAQGKGRVMVSDPASLKSEVERRRQQFTQGRDWIEKTVEELKTSANQGWGLEGAQVTMPERTVVMATTTACPVCHGQRLITCPECRGQGLIICTYCQGRGQERCYVCGGSGHNPHNPNERCPKCNGTQYALCRYCNGRRQLTCPTCHGNRGTPCPNCQGKGQLTEEVAIVFSAETHFQIKSQGLPSGLRRGLDRLGIAKLPPHADIAITPPKLDENAAPPKEGEKQATPPEIRYVAKLPYADIKIRFGADARAVMIGAFGKRGALLDVPPFLDEALQPARKMLQQGITNAAAFEGALKARAIREALQTELGGGDAKEFRRFYPYGISQDVLKEIFINLRSAMKGFTLRLRTIVSIFGAAVSAGIFGLLFLTDMHTSLTQNLPVAAVFLLDLILLVTVMAFNVFVLNAASRVVLQRRFPDLRIALKMRMSKTAYGLLGGIFVIYMGILFAAPVKVVWLQTILSHP